MKMVESVLGILGAAARQTDIVCGFEDSERLSGDTSPKKRNSWSVESCRMKKAEDS